MLGQISQYLDSMTVNLTLAKKDGKIVVSVIPKMFNMEDSVANAIPPFIVTATAEELDQKFAEAFVIAAKSLVQIETDLNAWKKQADEAKLKSESAKKIADEKKKKDDANKKEASEKVKKGDEFFEKKEFDRAVAYYKSALSLTPGDASILAKCQKAESQTKGFDMFSTVQDACTVPFDEEDDDKMIEEEYDFNTDNDPNA